MSSTTFESSDARREGNKELLALMAALNDVAKRAGVAQSALAEVFDVSPNAYSHWCNGKRVPRGKNMLIREIHRMSGVILEMMDAGELPVKEEHPLSYKNSSAKFLDKALAE